MKYNGFGKINVCNIYIVLFILILFQPHVSWAFEKEIQEMTSAIAENIVKSGKTRIAVVYFTDLHGHVNELGRFLTEEISVALMEKGKGFEIVDRTHIQTLIKEYKLSATGLVDPSTAQKLGQIAGVDALVTGTITPFSDTVRLSVKVLDAQSAKLIGANACSITITNEIKALLRTGMQSSGTTLSIDPNPQLQAQQIVETKGFTFALQKCEHSGSSVTFHFLVTNNKENRKLGLYTDSVSGRTKIFDDIGNEYAANLAQIGKDTDSKYASTILVTSIPIKASIYVEKVETQASYISMIEISCWTLNDGYFKVQFRNIGFSK